MGAILQSLGRTVIAGVVLLVIIIILVGALTGKFIAVDMTWSTFFMRWLHVLSGVMWIGLLWYFNFVQMPSMPKISRPKVVPDRTAERMSNGRRTCRVRGRQRSPRMNETRPSGI